MTYHVSDITYQVPRFSFFNDQLLIKYLNCNIIEYNTLLENVGDNF